MKKIISMMMAMAMVMALAIPAFASTAPTFAAPADNGNEYTLTGVTQKPSIKVYVPSGSAAQGLVLNPYALGFKFDPTDDEEEPNHDQVISQPIYIGSQSDVPLNVGMTVKSTVASGVTLATKSLAADTKTTSKSAFLWGQIKGIEATSEDIPTAEPEFDKAYDATKGKSGDMILVAAETTRTGLYEIPASEDITNATKNHWACVKFFGDAVKAPTLAWTENDTVTLAITFTFTAVMNDGE